MLLIYQPSINNNTYFFDNVATNHHVLLNSKYCRGGGGKKYKFSAFWVLFLKVLKGFFFYLKNK